MLHLLNGWIELNGNCYKYYYNEGNQQTFDGARMQCAWVADILHLKQGLIIPLHVHTICRPRRQSSLVQVMVLSLVELSLLKLFSSIQPYRPISYSPDLVHVLLTVLFRTDETSVQEKALKLLETVSQCEDNIDLIFDQSYNVSYLMNVLLGDREEAQQAKIYILEIFHTAVRGEKGHIAVEKLVQNCYPLVHLLGLPLAEKGRNRRVFEENIGLIDFLTKNETNLRHFVSKEVLSNGSGSRRDRTSRFIRKLIDQLFVQCVLYDREPDYAIERSMEFILNIMVRVCSCRDLLDELLIEPQVVFLFAHIYRKFETKKSLNHSRLAQRIFQAAMICGKLPSYITNSHLFLMHVSVYDS